MTSSPSSAASRSRARKVLRALLIVAAVTSAILAVAVVTTVTIDLGPTLKSQAETQGSRFMERPMRIGRLSVHLASGRFVIDDLVIEGLEPDARPFLTAKRIFVSMPLRTLLERRVVFDTIEMTDWRMFVELRADGRHSLPRVTPRGPRGPSAWTTTLSYVRAHRGEFEFQDDATPWRVVTRNLDVTVRKPEGDYEGLATFTNGTVAIRDYVPFRADMSSAFTIVDGRVVFDAIDLKTDGTESRLVGDVNLRHWPEMMYRVESRIDFPRMREIFFARDRFTLSGTGTFDGTFHLFRETLPDGALRTGRELKGTFRSAVASVDEHRFRDLRGSVRWEPERLEVTDTTATLYGGSARFGFRLAPLGRGVTTSTLTADYQGIDLAALTEFLRLQGLRLAGRAGGRLLLEWPLGRFDRARGDGTVQLTAPAGVSLMTRREAPSVGDEDREGSGDGLFAGPLDEEAADTVVLPSRRYGPDNPVPLGGALAFRFGPEWVDIAASRVATPRTYVEFDGRTAYGQQSRIPFHVTSGDWQESDYLLIAVLDAFGAGANPIPIGGSGTFDGVMLGSVRSPRIEGTFSAEGMRAWDVLWGAARGSAVIENGYADVAETVITTGESAIYADGRFSLGFPRRDGGEELDARVRLDRRPIVDLRHAFGLDEYDMDGLLSGEFHVYGHYTMPLGFGTMAIASGIAYGEPFDSATAGLRFQGSGVSLDNLQVVKGGGRGSGAAYVAWNGTYSFNFDARGIPIESIALAQQSPQPLSGLVDFTAGGSGTFDLPRYAVRATIRDFFVADEGIGQIAGMLDINDDLLTLQFEAASPRLAVSGAGRIELTPGMDAELSFSVTDTSLDPYVRAFEPRLSPFTTAVASGSVRVYGELANVDNLVVDASVDGLEMSLFDYRIRNAMPIRIALDRHAVRIADMRLVGEGTQLDFSGVVSLHDERIAIRATGDANLGILQGFVSNIRSTGRAELSATFEGPLRDPAVGGTLTVNGGRIRHFALPHALENIDGDLRFDSRGVSLDGLTARLGGGDVQFGGRIDKEGYLPGRLDVTMTGASMRLRFPAGMQSLVDADLALQGSTESATLSGRVSVRDAVYSRPFNTGLFDLTGDTPVAGAAPVQTTLPLRYDVQIDAPSTIQIRNNTTRLVASADLRLQGTFDRPLLFGRVEIRRGDVLFEGRRYEVTRGTIDFNNPTRIEPFFDIQTETRVRAPGETYRVTVTATGPIGSPSASPSITFESDPPLQEVELLALLFSNVAPAQDVELGRYRTDITPQQQLLRDQVARALTGTLSSDVQRAVEQTFGVDTFQITPSLGGTDNQSARLDPGARVTIVKRLTDRIYLTYSRSLTSSSRDQIILFEIDQTERLSWILSSNEDRNYALELRFRRNF